MPQSPHFRFVLLSLSVMFFALPTANTQAATSASGCRHLSPDKMALCQQKSKAKAKMNKLHEQPKPDKKRGFDAKDLIWLLL